MRDMISGEGLRHTDLVAEVGLRANGLFLRVKLVTDDLLHGWKRHESPDRLRSRLNSLPQNLTSLYSRILENMELDDRNEVLLSLVPTLCAAKKLTPSEISYAMLSPAEKGAVEEPALFQRLPIISGGLLEMKFDFLSQCEVVVPCHETVIAFVINPRNGCFESLSRAMMLGHECLLNACIQRIVGQDASIQRSEWLTQAYDSETRTEKLTYWKCAIEWWIYYTKWLEIESGSSQAHRLRPLCGEPFQIWVLANGKMVYNYTYCKESVNSYHACSHPSPGLDTLLWLLIERKLSLTAVGLLGLQHRENQLLMPLGGPEQLLETMKMLDLRSKTTHREYDLMRSKATSWHPLLVAAARSQDKSLVIFLVSYAVDLSISPQDIIAAFESTIRGDRGMCQSILENIPKTMRSFELFRSMFKRILDNVLYSRTCPEEAIEMTKYILSSELLRLNRDLEFPETPLERAFRCFATADETELKNEASPPKSHGDEKKSIVGEDQKDKSAVTNGYQDMLIELAQIFLDHGTSLDVIIRAVARRHPKTWALVKDLPWKSIKAKTGSISPGPLPEVMGARSSDKY